MATPAGIQPELLSDCTCPVCQEVFVNPQRLKCRHTLCRKCVHKMTHQSDALPNLMGMEEGMDPFGLFGGLLAMGQRPKQSATKQKLRCPICREESERCEPDDAAESLVRVLRLMRDTRCCYAARDCQAEATVLCPCCNKRFCPQHYEAQMASVREAGTRLCQELRSILSPDEANASGLQQLQAATDGLAGLQDVLAEVLQRGVADFRQQVHECRAQLQAPIVEAGEARAALEADLQVVAQHLQSGNVSRLARLLPAATERLKAAERQHPPRLLAMQFQPDQLISDLSSMVLRLSASTYRSPYTKLQPVLTRVQARSLTQKPWDIGILSNLEGVTCVDGALKLGFSASNGAGLSGPLLVINVQCFPTKMLHVTDMDVHQVATITPKFDAEGMPGRMHICNERQLILTSDAGRHRVVVFNLEGQLVTSFGEKGSGPRQFHAPLGICASRGKMFVVDSKNRRVQVFDMDSDYTCVASVEHDGFSNGISSVLANDSSIFVVDRDRSSLFVFDKETRALVTPQVSLAGKPFDIVPDEFGNAFVTIVDGGRVQIVHRLGSLKTVGFKETTHENQTQAPEQMMLPFMMPSASPPRMFHGAAYEPTARRLFIADLMRNCIIVAEL